MSWLLEDVSYIKICNRNHLRRPIKRDSHAVLHQYIFHSKLTYVASYKHWKLLIWTPKRLEKKRQVSDIYWSNWKRGYHHTEPTVPNCTYNARKTNATMTSVTISLVLGVEEPRPHWQYTVVMLVRGATVSAVNSRQVRKLLDNNDHYKIGPSLSEPHIS